LSAAPYAETRGSLLFPGFQHSLGTLQPTVLLAEQILHQRPHQRARTVWRLDAGFGSDSAINWLLARDYQLVTKGYNSRRAQKVVSQIAPDTWQVLRPNKWVAVVPDGVRYARRTQTLAVRWLTEAQRERCALLIHTLLDEMPRRVIEYYDQRGGAMEVDSIKQDKFGLQLTHRRKRSWYAQEAWIILTDLAHNLLTWLHDWMLSGSSFETYGNLRLVQDVLSIPGRLEFEGDKLQKVALQATHPFAHEMQDCLAHLFHNLS
jgi:Transposase DDE domain group 1